MPKTARYRGIFALGRQLEDIVNDDSFWICLNIAAIAPDGRDVMDDNSGFTQSCGLRDSRRNQERR
jgi:hypothetical protein